MNTQEIKTIIMRELPHIMQTDEEIRRFIVSLGRERFADKDESARRFDRMMDELAEQRQQSQVRWEAQHRESARRWDKNEEQWKKNEEQWKKNEQRWQENEQRWQKNQDELAEQRQQSQIRWEAHHRESVQQWEENQQRWDERWKKMHQEFMGEIRKLHQKHDSAIGALGARWGTRSEASFRNGLRGILTDHFGVEVISVNEFDDEGTVFGRPDQVELDIIIRNGTLIICEIKSSISKPGMYIFERKVRFYEKRHGKKADKMMVISPMVDDRAKLVAKNLGILVYSYAEDVETL